MKKVVWGEPQLQNPNSPYIQGVRNFKDEWAKALERDEEEQAAVAFLQKARPGMAALLEMKLKGQEPLIVMRPIQYTATETVNKSGNPERPNFKIEMVQKMIYPGTQLVLKSIDPNMQSFIFVNGAGEEVELGYGERDKLMTHTNIYELTKHFIENNLGE